MSNSPTIRVGVLFGGRSGEHEVSLASARNVMDALQQAGHTVIPLGITREGRWLTTGDPLQQLTMGGERPNGEYRQTAANGTNDTLSKEDSWSLLPQANREQHLPTIDVIFPVLHGPYGEDGTVQGMLEIANLPYVGCSVLSSAVAMDKAITKKILAAEDIRQTPYHVVMRDSWVRQPDMILAKLEQRLNYSLFVKPANLGSSVGVSKAENRQQLVAALDLAARYDRKLLVEEAVANAREIEVSVLGNSGSSIEPPIASTVGEIIPGNEFYDYEAKYLDDSSQLLIPALLDAEQTNQIQEMALQAFNAIDGSGLARVDFLLNDETGKIYLNELNTMPGFTRISMYPKLWEASGISYPELVDRLIQLALARHEDRQQNSTIR